MKNLGSLNPYFIGLSTLIIVFPQNGTFCYQSQSLFYWIIYSYSYLNELMRSIENVSILILLDYLLLLTEKLQEEKDKKSLNPYFIGLSTLIIE